MNFSFLGGSSLSQLVIPESQDESVSTLSNETQDSTINSTLSVITSVNNDDLRVSSLKKITKNIKDLWNKNHPLMNSII